MDAISSEALVLFNDAVDALFADLTSPPDIYVLSMTIKHIGLGGFVGIHPDPYGDIVGRRIDAQMEARIVNNNAAQRRTAALAVQQALLDPGEDQPAGILRLQIDNSLTAGFYADNEHRIGFRVLFEFLKIPEEAGDIITEIPVTVSHDDEDETFTITGSDGS